MRRRDTRTDGRTEDIGHWDNILLRMMEREKFVNLHHYI